MSHDAKRGGGKGRVQQEGCQVYSQEDNVVSDFFNGCFVGHHVPVFVFAHTPAAGLLMCPISLHRASALMCPSVCVGLFPQECVCVLIEAISWQVCAPVCVS